MTLYYIRLNTNGFSKRVTYILEFKLSKRGSDNLDCNHSCWKDHNIAFKK